MTLRPSPRKRRHRWRPTKEPPANTSALWRPAGRGAVSRDILKPHVWQETLRLLLEQLTRRGQILWPPNVHPGAVERIRPRLQPLLQDQVHQVIEAKWSVLGDERQQFGVHA